MAKVGFVLSNAPQGHPGARTVYHLAVAALNGGHEVLT